MGKLMNHLARYCSLSFQAATFCLGLRDPWRGFWAETIPYTTRYLTLLHCFLSYSDTRCYTILKGTFANLDCVFGKNHTLLTDRWLFFNQQISNELVNGPCEAAGSSSRLPPIEDLRGQLPQGEDRPLLQPGMVNHNIFLFSIFYQSNIIY